MVDIPTSVPVFPDYADDVDDVMAAVVNTPNDELTALATMIGVLGVSQSKSVDFLDAIVNAIAPTVVFSYSSTTAIAYTIGRCFPQNSGGSQRVIRKNTAASTISGSNLDTGGPSFAINTTYYIYGNGDAVATTFTFKISTSSSAPSGTTIYQKLGGFATDSSGNIIELSIWSAAPIKLRGVTSKIISTVDTATTASNAMFLDNTKPQITEGKELFTADIIPKDTTNFLVFIITGMISCNSGSHVVFAIFQDATADALAAAAHIIGNNTNMFVMTHKMLAGTTAKTTFRFRYGPVSGGNTVYINGDISGNQLFGGIAITQMLILEFGQ